MEKGVDDCEGVDWTRACDGSCCCSDGEGEGEKNDYFFCTGDVSTSKSSSPHLWQELHHLERKQWIVN